MESISLISIIIVFLVIFIDLLQKKVDFLCGQDNPPVEQKEKYNNRKKELVKTVYLYSLPLTIIISFYFYLLLPTVIKVFSISKFRLWYFDLSNTLFIFFEIINLIVLIISVIQFIKIKKELKLFINESKK